MTVADDLSEGPRHDLRLPAAAAVGWLACLVGWGWHPWTCGVAVAAAVAITAWRGRSALTGLLLLVAMCGGFAGGLHREAVQRDVVTQLAMERAVVHADLVITGDPRVVEGRYGTRVRVTATVRRVEGRGQVAESTARVVVWAPASWSGLALGAEVRVAGRLAASDSPTNAAILTTWGSPELLAEPPAWWEIAEPVRDSVRRTAQARGPIAEALVPSLVVGDDAAVTEELREDFQDAGMTHLLVVSGTNLTLLIQPLLGLAVLLGVRGRWLSVVGMAGVVAFVVIARPEPSVLRAAAMGIIGVLALQRGGESRSARSLGAAVLVLLMISPELALSPGFALSVSATAGLVLWAARWSLIAQTWLPRPLADAVVVPLAASLACTPLIVAISGQLSLVAVLANVAAAPFVGPATVLGMLAGLIGTVSLAVGAVVAIPAAWSVRALAAIAAWSADRPHASMTWEWTALSGAVLVALVVLAVAVLPWLLRRPAYGAITLVLVIVVGVVRWPTPGWPPPGWLMVMCDVGQGDGLVMNAGQGAAVVIDVGLDDGRMADCLADLEVTSIPLLVLTHYHADHVAGLGEVAAGWPLHTVVVSPLASPAPNAQSVATTLAPLPVAAGVPTPGDVMRVGQVTVTFLAPGEVTANGADHSSDEGSGPNNASVVALAEISGVSVLFTGDIEPLAQVSLARAVGEVHVDILKVPHHGSGSQDAAFLTTTQASVALISVGADNDYGHPAPETLGLLTEAGMDVWRTDLSGDVAVVADGSRWWVVAR